MVQVLTLDKLHESWGTVVTKIINDAVGENFCCTLLEGPDERETETVPYYGVFAMFVHPEEDQFVMLGGWTGNERTSRGHFFRHLPKLDRLRISKTMSDHLEQLPADTRLFSFPQLEGPGNDERQIRDVLRETMEPVAILLLGSTPNQGLAGTFYSIFFLEPYDGLAYTVNAVKELAKNMC